jgi:ATP-dependent exoDNAse (exonuclease V) beta subunit
LEKNNFENINLNTCHRSNKTLVSFYNNLFSCKNHNFLNNLNEIYTSELEYNIKDEKISNSINFILTNNEALSILEKIKELNQEDYKYGDIMILFRKNKKAKELINLLKNNSIPFISYLDSSLKSNLEVITVLNLLKLIKYPFDKLNLISVLKSPIFCFSDLDIFNIKDKLDIYQIENFECIRSLINDLNKYSIYDILKTLYKEFKIVETFSLYPDSMQKIENLNKLLKIASNFDRNNFQFRDFINFLDENEQEQTENLLIEDTNFIKIMTIHKSKGLESKIVIIPYLLDIDDIEDEGFYNIDNLMVKIKNNNKVIAQSSNFDEKRVKNKIKNAEKRLLYVAFTRAKEKLILLASKNKSSKNKNKSSKNTSSSNELKREIFDLVKTIESYNETNFKEDNLQNTEYKNYWNSLKNNKQLELSKLQEFQNIDKKRINDYEESIMNKKFSSVSQLMQIEKIDDYESFILDNDENLYKNNHSSELGTFVHKVLENFNFPKDISFAENEILSIIDYQKKTIVNENILNEAKEILLNFLNSKYYNEISNSKILFKELPFTLKENDVYIEGIIDLVYENNNKIIIMDYKTNKIHDKEKLEKNYYLQKKYYTEAIKVIFPERSNDEIEFKFCWLREVI